jgi:hypothetical protein
VQTLLVIADKRGRILARCNATCYDNPGASPECACGGEHRGIGREAATKSARVSGLRLLIAWLQYHPESQPYILVWPKGRIILHPHDPGDWTLDPSAG